MTSGIDYAENDFPFGMHVRFYYTNRLEQQILGLRLKEQPGTRFAYKSGDALLLTPALKRALGGKHITQYMQERIWDPLGMEADGIWSIDHAPDGLEKASCCLAATARDFAKLGRLYLNKALWMANGHLGQFLYVNPSAGVIIVRLGRSMGGLNRDEWTQIFTSLSAGIRRRSEDGT